MRCAALWALAVAIALAGCGTESGGGVGKGSGPLTVYMGVPLSGPDAARGRRDSEGAKAALAAAGGHAGDRDLKLVVLDDSAGGAPWSPVATGANARQATEDAGAITYLGDIDPGATATSLPITDSAELPQVVLGRLPAGLDVDNIVELPPKSQQDPGAAAMTLVLTAVERAGCEAGDRSAVLDELRKAAAS